VLAPQLAWRPGQPHALPSLVVGKFSVRRPIPRLMSATANFAIEVSQQPLRLPVAVPLPTVTTHIGILRLLVITLRAVIFRLLTI
jgi:hypothetical protein